MKRKGRHTLIGRLRHCESGPGITSSKFNCYKKKRYAFLPSEVQGCNCILVFTRVISLLVWSNLIVTAKKNVRPHCQRPQWKIAKAKANKAKVFDPYHLSLLTLLSSAQYEGGALANQIFWVVWLFQPLFPGTFDGVGPREGFSNVNHSGSRDLRFNGRPFVCCARTVSFDKVG